MDFGCNVRNITANPDLPISYFLSQSSVEFHSPVIELRNSSELEVFQPFLVDIFNIHGIFMASKSADYLLYTRFHKLRHTYGQFELKK